VGRRSARASSSPCGRTTAVLQSRRGPRIGPSPAEPHGSRGPAAIRNRRPENKDAISTWRRGRPRHRCGRAGHHDDRAATGPARHCPGASRFFSGSSATTPATSVYPAQNWTASGQNYQVQGPGARHGACKLVLITTAVAPRRLPRKRATTDFPYDLVPGRTRVPSTSASPPIDPLLHALAATNGRTERRQGLSRSNAPPPASCPP